MYKEHFNPYHTEHVSSLSQWSSNFQDIYEHIHELMCKVDVCLSTCAFYADNTVLIVSQLKLFTSSKSESESCILNTVNIIVVKANTQIEYF